MLVFLFREEVSYCLNPFPVDPEIRVTDPGAGTNVHDFFLRFQAQFDIIDKAEKSRAKRSPEVRWSAVTDLAAKPFYDRLHYLPGVVRTALEADWCNRVAGTIFTGDTIRTIRAWSEVAFYQVVGRRRTGTGQQTRQEREQ
ncbi:hypothetical protein JCM39068_05790 [Desulfocastanea catecholica]